VNPTVHELKTWPEFFALVVNGNKNFELRPDDRGFEVGDVLWLREWLPAEKKYTGRYRFCWVDYVLRDAYLFGLKAGFVAMSVTPMAASVPCTMDGVSANAEREEV